MGFLDRKCAPTYRLLCNISDEELSALNLKLATFHADQNYRHEAKKMINLLSHETLAPWLLFLRYNADEPLFSVIERPQNFGFLFSYLHSH